MMQSPGNHTVWVQWWFLPAAEDLMNRSLQQTGWVTEQHIP